MQPTVTLPGADLYLGECLSVLPHLPPASVDAVVCDPPYPCIQRSYGRLTEAEWHAMMRALVPEVRRVLKPQGSAVFVLQPNSERVGRMRPWLWQFMAWLCEEWNVVQDAYWWNNSALPLAGANKLGLMRPSVKTCVWCGPEDCYRNQSAVRIPLSERQRRQGTRFLREGPTGSKVYPSGRRTDRFKTETMCLENGGTVPFNLFVGGNGKGKTRGGDWGHGAATPFRLCSWWVKYVSPVGGAVLDPFQGSGTVGLAALSLGRRYVGIEKEPDYHAIAARRLTEAAGPLFANAPETVDFDSPPPDPQPTLFPL